MGSPRLQLVGSAGIPDRFRSAQIDGCRRAVRYEGFLGARLRAGTICSPPQRAGVGDGILIRPDRAFFAVGDGSDRNPRAVRQVMERFTSMLAEIPDLDPDRTHRQEDLPALRERLSGAANALLRDLCPGDGCTLTGILLLHTKGGLRGLLFHTGDSLLYHGDAESGETQRLTKSNFWLVGRTDRFFQIDEIPLRDSSRLLLATDGFHALFPAGRSCPEEILGELFIGEAVEEIPERLFEGDGSFGGGRDDAAILCFTPARRSAAWPPILLGGTSAAEEGRLQIQTTSVRTEDDKKTFSRADNGMRRGLPSERGGPGDGERRDRGGDCCRAAGNGPAEESWP